MRIQARRAQIRLPSELPMGPTARKMTLHLAAALLLFTVLQLWSALAAIAHGAPAWLPLIGLAVLILGAIPFVRHRERRWSSLRSGTLPSPAIAEAFRADVKSLWALAITVPPGWTLIACLLLIRH